MDDSVLVDMLCAALWCAAQITGVIAIWQWLGPLSALAFVVCWLLVLWRANKK